MKKLSIPVWSICIHLVLRHDIWVDQLIYDSGLLIDGSCEIINDPKISDDFEKFNHLNQIDSLNIFFVKNHITCFANGDHVVENTSKKLYLPYWV